MIALQRVKKLALDVTVGLVSFSFRQSPVLAASQVQLTGHANYSSESGQDRLDTPKEARDYYKSIP